MRLAEGGTAFPVKNIDRRASQLDSKLEREVLVRVVVGRPDMSDDAQSLECQLSGRVRIVNRPSSASDYGLLWHHATTVQRSGSR
jgi:hypothetical protein